MRKSVLLYAAFGLIVLMGALAYARPWYFTNQMYLSGLIAIELMIAAIWMYRTVFFPLVLIAFLFAGVDLPVGHFWAAGRWLVLGIGAFIGCIIIVKERRYSFGAFHAVALFAVLICIASATVSQHPTVALLKALSLFLLFAYASTGARVAVAGREGRFFSGLLLGAQVFFVLLAVFYACGVEAMGNPNSLGALAGVVGVPLLLWATLLADGPAIRNRRLMLYGVCMLLVFHSHARAGILAALISSAVPCLALRKYKALIQGAVVISISVAASGLIWPETIPSLTSSIVYKGGTVEQGLLASRLSPWSTALVNIREHPWFGTGLGTTIQDSQPGEDQGMFASNSSVTAENGCSYLALPSGVGILGTLPFVFLLFVLVSKIFRTLVWMRISGVATQLAVPLAIVLLAGIVHAVFEDWLFAPGNYLAILFWCLAFILIDVAPSKAAVAAMRWRPAVARNTLNNLARGL